MMSVLSFVLLTTLSIEALRVMACEPDLGTLPSGSGQKKIVSNVLRLCTPQLILPCATSPMFVNTSSSGQTLVRTVKISQRSGINYSWGNLSSDNVSSKQQIVFYQSGVGLEANFGGEAPLVDAILGESTT